MENKKQGASLILKEFLSEKKTLEMRQGRKGTRRVGKEVGEDGLEQRAECQRQEGSILKAWEVRERVTCLRRCHEQTME